MTLIAKPNAWVAVEDAATKLTYAPAVNPAPLTTSVPKRAPTLGSLVVAITNNTEEDLVVARVTLLVVIGKPGPEGAPLMAGLPASIGVSDADSWEFLGPPAKFSEGLAEYVLKPKAGMGTLKVGESVLVELVAFDTVEEAGSSIVKVSETVNKKEALTGFSVPTFPGGFFFDSLVATVVEGSAHVPVAQVERGSKVVLLWSSSVSVDDQKVRYSNAAEGQKVEQPQESGRWTSPSLTADTVFSVDIEATGANGESLPAALTTSIAVKDPALIAASLKVGELNAGSATVSGALSSGSASVTGMVEAGSLTVTRGALVANQVPVSILGPTEEISQEGIYEVRTAGFFKWVELAKGPWSFVLPDMRIPIIHILLPRAFWTPIGTGKAIKVGDSVEGFELKDLLAPLPAPPLDAETKAKLLAALSDEPR